MFDRALKFVLKEEGGYANNPNDPGGATNFGITQAVYDRFRKRNKLPIVSVREIRKPEVEQIYHSNYWVDGRCDIISSIHGSLALVHFDSCINTGIRQAARFLQRSVGVDADGWIGPITLEAVRNMGEQAIIQRYLMERWGFYKSLVGMKPRLREFYKGWLFRLARLDNEVTP